MLFHTYHTHWMQPNTNHDKALNKEPNLFSCQVFCVLKWHYIYMCCHGANARKGRSVMTGTEKCWSSHRHSPVIYMEAAWVLIIPKDSLWTWCHAAICQWLYVYWGLMQDGPWWSLESGLFVSLTESITPPFLHELLDAKADPNTNCTDQLTRSLTHPTEQVMYV